MIIRAFRPDGTPDLTRWKVRCDLPGCYRTGPVIGSQAWLIPACDEMPTYCPGCFAALAFTLIGSALACPCGSADVRIYINTDIDASDPWHRLVGCADCGLILMTNDTPGGAP